jgi:hypothetical protein
MDAYKAKHMRIAGLAMLVPAGFQIVGLVRYLRRLPDDTLGVWLHVATIAAFVVAAILFFVAARKQDGAA